jgi:predicted TIM-barrel fold metal-dependent hydrolase
MRRPHLAAITTHPTDHAQNRRPSPRAISILYKWSFLLPVFQVPADKYSAMNRAGCRCSVPNFNPSDSLALCDKFGITTAILSHTAPGAEVEKDFVKAAALARQFNEYSASIRDQEPLRYGFFASLPSLHDTPACLAGIDYAIDTLHADGVILFTSYTSPPTSNSTDDGGECRVSYLGDPAFEPVWRELNRRRAVVLVHPTYTPNLSPTNQALPVTMLDFSHETARTALDLIVGNTLRDHARDCRIILSHGGGTLASVVDRVATLSGGNGGKNADIREEVGWFYFDTALCGEAQVDAVRRIAKPGHILFGSDLPNAPVDAVRHFIGGHGGGVDEDAARALFPKSFK